MSMKKVGIVLLAGFMAFSLAGCGESDGGGGDAVTNVAGTWRAVFTYADDFVETWILTVTQTGATVTGTVYQIGDEGDVHTIAATVTGNVIVIRETDEDGSVYVWNGVVTGNTMSGAGAYTNGDAPSTWIATKQ